MLYVVGITIMMIMIMIIVVTTDIIVVIIINTLQLERASAGIKAAVGKFRLDCF